MKFNRKMSIFCFALSIQSTHDRSATNSNANTSSNSGSEQSSGGGYTCPAPDCGRVYKLKSSLRNHQKWECGNNNNQSNNLTWRIFNWSHILVPPPKKMIDLQNDDHFLGMNFWLNWNFLLLLGWNIENESVFHVFTGKAPQFQCPFCVYRAKQKMHIGRHMERMHKNNAAMLKAAAAAVVAATAAAATSIKRENEENSSDSYSTSEKD